MYMIIHWSVILLIAELAFLVAFLIACPSASIAAII